MCKESMSARSARHLLRLLCLARVGVISGGFKRDVLALVGNYVSAMRDYCNSALASVTRSLVMSVDSGGQELSRPPYSPPSSYEGDITSLLDYFDALVTGSTFFRVF